jgi:hypothetical protein
VSNSPNLKESVRLQRQMLDSILSQAMRKLAKLCATVMDNRHELEMVLTEALPHLSYCKHLYVLNADGRQISSNITQHGIDESHFARERMDRPYMQGIVGVTEFKLSDAYISRNKKRPSLTAIQLIRDESGEMLGFLGADFDMRELPHTENLYKESEDWRQIKGDPAIRGGVFAQQRIDSLMDQQIDNVLSVMNELMQEHGVYHGKFHFSSNRATIWHVDDPFVYRLLSIDDLTDPNIVLAYPRRPYHERAIVPREKVEEVFEVFKQLRFADENVYLRAGSLNVINGMIGLNFSCDGSHYMRYDEFLDKNTGFWFGVLGS